VPEYSPSYLHVLNNARIKKPGCHHLA